MSNVKSTRRKKHGKKQNLYIFHHESEYVYVKLVHFKKLLSHVIIACQSASSIRVAVFMSGEYVKLSNVNPSCIAAWYSVIS